MTNETAQHEAEAPTQQVAPNNELLWRERLELAKSKLRGCHRDDRKHWLACRKEAELRLAELQTP